MTGLEATDEREVREQDMPNIKQRNYTIRMCIVEKELYVLKSALTDYAHQEHSEIELYIANDLLRLISVQEKRQDEQRQIEINARKG